MKVLLINGSPREKGNTYVALHEMETVFNSEGIETQIVHIGNKDIRGCIACGSCGTSGKCCFDDAVNETAQLFEEADGLVVGTPVYYASANGTLISYLDRLFYSTHFDKTMKVGAAVAAARRGGLTATYDELNKYFAICGMPIATGQYWNGIHGRLAGEANEDEEGLQQMRTLARNMAFLIKSIKLGTEQMGLPEKETPIRTNLVRP
ncbi:MAG: flavodoxin family protein [Clostridium sp.]|nr:flavodoxin family protein [Clostridium sp.]